MFSPTLNSTEIDFLEKYFFNSIDNKSLFDELCSKTKKVFLSKNMDISYTNNSEFYIQGFEIINNNFTQQLLQRWFLIETKKNNPSIFCIQRILNQPPFLSFTVTSCKDFVFLKKFQKDTSSYFLDYNRNIMTFKFYEIFNIEKFREDWMSWANYLHIITESPKYMLEKRKETFILHTMLLPIEHMRLILNSGFAWDQKNLYWSGNLKKVNIDIVSELIRQDKIPELSSLGYVPEYYSYLNLEYKSTKNKLELFHVLTH